VKNLEYRAVEELPALHTAPSTVLRAVRMVVFDFDGVFTDDAVYVSEDGR
jgi:3-deoxy-D-manno-octulosonate 8-phosphate phosphatase (KDO 8-P phosphatase)